MPSEYDVLLEPPKSEYDALLDTPEPAASPPIIPNVTELRKGKVVQAKDMPMPPASLLYNAGIPEPFAPNKEDSGLKAAAKAVGNLPVDVANFALSPAGMLLPAARFARKPLQALLGAAFTGQQVQQGIESDTLQGKIQSFLGAGLIGAGTLAHSLSSVIGEAKPEPLVPPDQVPIPELEKVAPEAKVLPTAEPPTGEPNAIQIESPTGLLPREQSQVGETGGERLGMGQVQQGQETPAEVAPAAEAGPVSGEVPPTPPEQRHSDLPTQEVPISELSLSQDVPQFKQGANEQGVVTALTGKFTREGVAPIAIWERTNGKREVISGRHRFDLAQRSGEKTIPAQIYKESEGVTPKIAAQVDAELNIRDEKGSTADYAQHFKNSGIDEAAAKERGLLGSAKSKAGFAIAQGGGEDLLALHRAGEVTDGQAEAIARAAPGNAGAQQIGIRAALDGKSAEYASNLIKAATSRAGPRATTADLFSFDDSAMQEMASQAKTASSIQSELRKTKSAITGASKDPIRAKAEGVDVKNPAQVAKRVAEINAELERWDNWPMHPDLVARTRGQTLAPDIPTLRRGENQGDLLSKQTEDLSLMGEKGTDFAARQAEEEKAARDAAEAQALQDKQQTDFLDWTGATEPTKMKLGGQEGGFVTIPQVDRGNIRKFTPLDEATTNRSAKLQQSFADAERAQKEIKKALPTKLLQEAGSIYREAGGDMAVLQDWEARAKQPWMRNAAKAAQNLTPDQVAMVQKVGQGLDVMEQRGNKYEVLTGHRDNYVPHVWDVTKKFSGIGSSKLQDTFKFNKARSLENFFEGDQAGMKPKNFGLANVFPAYLHEMNKVIADRQFVQDVQGGKASDGLPLTLPRGRVSTIESDSGGKAYLANPDAFKAAKDAQGNPIDQSKYKVLDQPALHDWRWEAKDENGNPIFMKDDLAVHPELAKRLNAMTGQSAIRQWYNEPSTALSTVPRAIAKGLDTAQSVMKREMFGLLAPFHQVQEGTHGVGHLVNPVDTFNMSRPTPEHIDAMKHGLMLLPDRASGQNYMEGLGGKGTFLTQAARWVGEQAAGKGKLDDLTSKAATGLADVVDGYQNYLFHNYIPGLKFKTYTHMLGRNMSRFKDELASGKVSEADVKLLSAEQSNAAFGHLNLALLDRNPTMQHIGQLLLLAPDFLEARSRFVGQAAKALWTKGGNEQLRAIATLAAFQASQAYISAKLSGGEWDAKRPFEFTKNGKSYFLRSVPEDFHRLFLQGYDKSREFVSARINPLLQKGVQLETGLNYRGEKVGPIETGEELLANYIPITARAIPALRNLTETSRNNPISPLEQLAGALGVKISRHSPITSTHELANAWMDKQKIERSAGSYPVSKYLPMRYALEDGDLERAKAEFHRLQETEKDVNKLSKGFKSSINHPFTGSQENDRKFAASLNGKDKLIYEQALQTRKGIMDKFHAIGGTGESRR